MVQMNRIIIKYLNEQLLFVIIEQTLLYQHVTIRVIVIKYSFYMHQ